MVNSCHRRLSKDKNWQIFWLNIQIQEQSNFMKSSQMRLLKFLWPKHPAKNNSGNILWRRCRLSKNHWEQSLERRPLQMRGSLPTQMRFSNQTNADLIMKIMWGPYLTLYMILMRSWIALRFNFNTTLSSIAFQLQTRAYELAFQLKHDPEKPVSSVYNNRARSASNVRPAFLL